ncbi:MAG: tRNA (adenosine(37)-N6)-threonylcarbamoyltransferase complex ATPase subunit type 1 TsaE [Niabella sp.]
MIKAEKTYPIKELEATAAWLWELVKDHNVIVLNGNMGAGKTTLVSAICHKLGVTDAVSSPTFSIINEYRYKEKGADKSIYHIDLYRLKDEQEAINAGVEDCLYSGGYCFVEWPERAPGLFPDDTVNVYLYHEGDSDRTIEIEMN